jgi:hypothetical protein
MFRVSSVLTCAALTLSLGATLSGPVAARAQSVTVNIPFNFSANDQKGAVRQISHLTAGPAVCFVR